MALTWPFDSKDPSQYSQVDQGWDLNTSAGGHVHAIAPGTISHILDDPGGFGHHYPIEHLDASIGGPSPNVYYGHATALVSVGQHVNAGDVIAVTHTASGDGNGGPGHLEIGFATDAGNPISAGAVMRQLLLGAGAGGAGTAPAAAASSGGGSSFDWTDPSSWGPALEQMIADLPGEVIKSLLGGHTLAEIALRAVEVVAGAAALAIGGVMVVHVVASGGQSGRVIRSSRRAGRRVTRSARRAGRTFETSRRRSPSPKPDLPPVVPE